MSIRIYVAGPMTGLPNYNWPAFEAAARVLRHKGYEVVTPTEIDEEYGVVDVQRNELGDITSVTTTTAFDYEMILARDLEAVDTVDAIFLLPDWHRSTGAKRELHRALANGATVILYKEVFTDALV